MKKVVIPAGADAIFRSGPCPCVRKLKRELVGRESTAKRGPRNFLKETDYRVFPGSKRDFPKGYWLKPGESRKNGCCIVEWFHVAKCLTYRVWYGWWSTEKPTYVRREKTV